MARETAAERRARIEKEVADRSAARKEAYFDKQEKAKAAAEAKLPPLPEPDAYIYNYAWRQDVGGAGGEYVLTKTPNPYYDPRNNEITDPKTGEKTTMTLSPWSGPTSFRGDTTATTDPYAGLTPEQIDARKNAEELAAKLGLAIDPKTGMIIKPPANFVIDPKTGKYVDPSKLSKPGVTEVRRVTNSDGSVTITYSDGTTSTIPAKGNGNTGFSTTGNGNTTATTYTAPDGRIFTDLNAYNAYIAQTAAEEKRKAGQSAYDLLFSEFDRYGMGALLNDVKEFIVQGLSRDELLLKLRATPAYEKRFAANAQRIKKGLRALSEAEYINLEDQYQDVMRRYGLPESYYTRGDMGVQQGFEKFLAGDVSPLELEDRIQTGQRRVLNAPKEVKDALTQFYGAELGNGDILAYVLDPERAIENIKRKVTAAEIGAGAMQSGLKTGLTRAEELEKFGVTGERARTGYAAIAEFLPSATKLGDIYAKQGLGAYDQATAEQEVFGITGAAGAATKRRKLSELEQAQFSGSSGMTGGALSRERAGQF